MPVALLLPTTSSGGAWTGAMPLTTARRYVRGPGNSRWHRPRSGMQWPNGRISLSLWCGPSLSDSADRDQLLTADEVPADQPVCGTCEGRAIGAGQDPSPDGVPPLMFTPRWQAPPRFCPGSASRDLWASLQSAARSVGTCLACGDLVSIRVIGRGYNAWGAGPIRHYPGAGLISPCPFHAWQRIVRRGDVAGCACGWPHGVNEGEEL